MKFEKITNKKFDQFESDKIKNLNAIIGGAVFTEGNGSHDVGSKTKGTWELDDVVTTKNGGPSSSDTMPD